MENVAENILKRSLNNINEKDVEIIPCNTNVVILPYDENPYKKIDVTETGLILGVESSKVYKSSDTGEIEDVEEGIICAKVIAVGPGCRNVQIGEDVYVTKHLTYPLPFRRKGYRVITEQNIICRIV